VEQAVARGEAKALAGDGLLVRGWAAPTTPGEAPWLRFVAGRPVGGVTTQYRAWCRAKPAAAGKTALPLVWDNASWHISQEVRTWIADHNRRGKPECQGVRVVPCPRPTKSPRPNRIDPKWMHGKRRAVEPARLLTAAELERAYDAFGADHAVHLTMPKQAT
jgi:hypothetical protein